MVQDLGIRLHDPPGPSTLVNHPVFIRRETLSLHHLARAYFDLFPVLWVDKSLGVHAQQFVFTIPGEVAKAAIDELQVSILGDVATDR